MVMDTKMNFVQTDDETTASTLRDLGYTELGKQGSLFCFINDGKATFSEDVSKTVEYTNVTAMVTA